jgi:chromosomal replication initiation ATPase DnaA
MRGISPTAQDKWVKGTATPKPKPKPAPFRQTVIVAQTYEPFTLTLIHTIARGLSPRRLSHQRIIFDVAEKHGLSVVGIISPCRDSVFVNARVEAYRRLRDELGYSYPKIAKIFNRDHSTVVHACNREANKAKRLARKALAA